MSLRSSGALSQGPFAPLVSRPARLVALALVPAALALAPAAAAQGTPAGQGTAPAHGTATTSAPKKGDPKKADPTPATTAPATEPAAPATPTTTEPAKPTEPVDATSDTSNRRAVYISLDFGFARADVGGLSDSTGFDKTGANGVFAGLGLGYRFKNLRLGARFRDTSTTEFNLWSLMGEVGYGLPFKVVTPVLFVHAGYMFDTGIERSVIASSLPKGNILTPNLGLDGAVLGAELLANVHLSSFLRIGPFIGFDFTWLHRKQVDLPQSIVPLTDETKNNPLYTGSGSGVGYVFNLGIRGTGDIAF